MAGRRRVIVGVDTHAARHCAAVLDVSGRLLGTEEFEASVRGYRALLGWVRTFGLIESAGIEGTAAYGVGLVRSLVAEGVVVFEVQRPDRRARRNRGQVRPHRRRGSCPVGPRGKSLRSAEAGRWADRGHQEPPRRQSRRYQGQNGRHQHAAVHDPDGARTAPGPAAIGRSAQQGHQRLSRTSSG